MLVVLRGFFRKTNMAQLFLTLNMHHAKTCVKLFEAEDFKGPAQTPGGACHNTWSQSSS